MWHSSALASVFAGVSVNVVLSVGRVVVVVVSTMVSLSVELSDSAHAARRAEARRMLLAIRRVCMRQIYWGGGGTNRSGISALGET
jgi:hypothetical protein